MTSQAPVAVRRELEPTHPCMRCGREGVPADAALCELCNPLELSQPSATQMHGIAAVGIIGFVLVLALAGRLAMAATGPFEARVDAVSTAPGGLAITLSISNEGTNASATTCRVRQVGRPGSAVAIVQVPRVGGGATVQVTTTLGMFGAEPVQLSAECGSQ